jgi:hypothetical protein
MSRAHTLDEIVKSRILVPFKGIPEGDQETCKVWGLVHLSARRRIFRANAWSKTWTCPFPFRPISHTPR